MSFLYSQVRRCEPILQPTSYTLTNTLSRSPTHVIFHLDQMWGSFHQQSCQGEETFVALQCEEQSSPEV